MHQVHETLDIIGQNATHLTVRQEKIKCALGCRLARSVSMDIDAPPFDRAVLDGYAVRAADAVAGAQLQIVGRHDAGGPGVSQVGPGQCVAINTGAPMPAGADAVAMVEYTRPVPTQPAFVQLTNAVDPGWGVQRQGSDARAGAVVLQTGTRLTPAALAIAAAAGAHHLWVEPRPRVAILVTGDELTGVDRQPGPAEIRNTNSVLLCGLVEQFASTSGGYGADDATAAWVALMRQMQSVGLVPCDVLDLGVARDNEAEIRSALTQGFAEADVVLVTGGMSMGTRDLVPQVLVELGVRMLVQKVRIKPGKPFIFGTLEWVQGDASARKYVAGLPGNPVSAFVCFKRFVEPLLRALQGVSVVGGPVQPTLLSAVCQAPLPANGDREFYQPCRLDLQDDRPCVTPLAWKGSADIYTLAAAQALIVHPALAPARPAGAAVDILLL